MASPTPLIDISDALLAVGLGDSATAEEEAVVRMAVQQARGAIVRYLGYDPAQGSITEILPRTVDRAAVNRIWDSTDTHAVLVDQSGHGTSLQLAKIPVRSVTNVWVDNAARGGSAAGAFADATKLTSGTDFWVNTDVLDSSGNKVCRDGLIWNAATWNDEPGSIKVEYIGGYTVAELRGQDSVLDATPIWDACIDEVVRRSLKMFTVRKTARGWNAGNITAERLGDYSVSYGGVTTGTAADRRTGGTYDLLPETREKLSEFVNWGAKLSGLSGGA